MNDMSEQALTAQLSALRFALIDLGLFLDTHPDNAEALELYDRYNRQYAALARTYNETVGPLMPGDVSGQNGWSWGATPMPYEGGN